MAKIVDVLQCKYGIFGVLGNHDFIEMVPDLEAMGIKILLNESAKIKKGDECFWIVGVDDSSTLNVHDLNKSLRDVPREAFKVLLAHSPDIFYDAASHMFDYYLCGHTHGGQICLPGGIPIITNASCPRDYIAGSWRFGKMEGYTSAGTGSSGLFVRFFCPPEITIHQLI
jgi:predicted MPP superfamily phosphohydrolase